MVFKQRNFLHRPSCLTQAHSLSRFCINNGHTQEQYGQNTIDGLWHTGWYTEKFPVTSVSEQLQKLSIKVNFISPDQCAFYKLAVIIIKALPAFRGRLNYA